MLPNNFPEFLIKKRVLIFSITDSCKGITETTDQSKRHLKEHSLGGWPFASLDHLAICKLPNKTLGKQDEGADQYDCVESFAAPTFLFNFYFSFYAPAFAFA